jgi:hypothetical protein
MNKIVALFGALVALFSSTVYAIEPLQNHTSFNQVGTDVGLVYPKSRPNCFPDQYAPSAPPLPRNVPHATYFNTAFPPLRFQKDARVRVTFETPEQVNADGGINGRPFCGSTVFAFSDFRTMTLPNPCQYPKTDQYANMMCGYLGNRSNVTVTIYFESNTISVEKNVIKVPSPCMYSEQDGYARITCHELGHINGWPDYHGD